MCGAVNVASGKEKQKSRIRHGEVTGRAGGGYFLDAFVDLIEFNFHFRSFVGLDVTVIDIRVSKFIRLEGNAIEARAFAVALEIYLPSGDQVG